MASSPAYLDATAAAKLVRAERESAALIEAIAAHPLRYSSEIVAVELRGALHKLERPELLRLADPLLAAIELIPFDARVRARAGAGFDPPQRALDAVHLASALLIPEPDVVFVTYDDRQAIAAEAAGLNVLTPV
jgi:hypothetical protein